MSLYNVNSYNVSTILEWAKSEEIAIPEMQRPFVWKAVKVRDLIDSLYKGFPVGYLIIWKKPDVRLKDGSLSQGKRILIDGQQRVTALKAALGGLEVIDAAFHPMKIVISFNLITETFEVLNAAIKKDSRWIQDISEVFSPNFNSFTFVSNYAKIHDIEGQEVQNRLMKLLQIRSHTFGCIDLNDSLSIEDVASIFVRINSSGVVLAQSDFAMSTIASDSRHNGQIIRKTIDYFCHLLQKPEDLTSIKDRERDSEYFNSEEGRAIRWVNGSHSTLYQPDYKQVLRVAFLSKFGRAKMGDLVSLLSGRDFEARTFKEEIAEASFKKLREGLLTLTKKNNFEKFNLILRSAGFVSKALIQSQVTMDFVYALYLLMKERGYKPAVCESVARRWFALSLLTQRYTYSGSDTQMDRDIKELWGSECIPQTLKDLEDTELNIVFWERLLPDQLAQGTTINNQLFNVFLAAQASMNAPGFLSDKIDCKSLLEQQYDIHHLFPKKYLDRSRIAKNLWNQVGNYALTQRDINIQIKDKAPFEYMKIVKDQCEKGKKVLGGICSEGLLKENLRLNAIPETFVKMTAEDYEDFLEQRRLLMTDICRNYYESLK